WARELGDAIDRLPQIGCAGRLGNEREGAARQAVLTSLVQRHDLHWDMPGRRILLELAQKRPAEHVGKEYIQRHSDRPIFSCERERFGAARSDQHLEAVI